MEERERGRDMEEKVSDIRKRGSKRNGNEREQERNGKELEREN